MALPGGSYPRGTVSARRCLGRSHGEIQIYAPTAPGVFFELMKNESSHERVQTTLHTPGYTPRAPGAYLLRLPRRFPMPYRFNFLSFPFHEADVLAPRTNTGR